MRLSPLKLFQARENGKQIGASFFFSFERQPEEEYSSDRTCTGNAAPRFWQWSSHISNCRFVINNVSRVRNNDATPNGGYEFNGLERLENHGMYLEL